jgi:hypothetical protein
VNSLELTGTPHEGERWQDERGVVVVESVIERSMGRSTLIEYWREGQRYYRDTFALGLHGFLKTFRRAASGQERADG